MAEYPLGYMPSLFARVLIGETKMYPLKNARLNYIQRSV